MTLESFVTLCEPWFRLAMFILGPVRDALLCVLHRNGVPDQPKHLYNYLQSKKTLLAELKGRRVITQPQWNILFPPGKNETNCNLFDITLIVLLISELTPIAPIDGNWRNTAPSVMDISVGAFCIRAKNMRNYLNHFPHIAALKEPEFSVKWDELFVIINGLQYNCQFNISDLKAVSLDLNKNLLLRALILCQQTTLNHHDTEIHKLRNENICFGNKTNISITNLEEELDHIRCKLQSRSTESESLQEEIMHNHMSITQIETDIEYLKDNVKDVVNRTDGLESRMENLEGQALSGRIGELEDRQLPHRTEVLEDDICKLKDDSNKLKSQIKGQEVDYKKLTSVAALKIVTEMIKADWEILSNNLEIAQSFTEPTSDENKMERCFEKAKNKIYWKRLKYELGQLQRQDIIDEITSKTCCTYGGTDDAGKKHFWNVHQTVSNFTGREIVLDELYTKLNSPTNYSYSAVALTGLGGIGKTETAARYAHIYGKECYDNVFWIHADSDSLKSSLFQLSYILNLDPRNTSIEVLLPAICNSLINTQCLFVFDNVECMKSIQPVLKNLNLNKKPHMIITSQFSQWSGLGIQQIELDVFTSEEAVKFFQFVDDSENEVLKDLIAELQRLPLAMQQAASYIKRHPVSVKAYLDAFRNNRKQLLNVNLNKCGEAINDKTLLTVWLMALEKLEVYEHKVAIDVINMMAHMDGNFINTKTFLLDENIEDEIDLNEIVDMLCEYSLISKKNSDATQATVVTMHKLVQKVLKLYSEEERSKKKSKVVQERLCNILMKAKKASHSWDNDEENIWYIHMKKLWKEGLILDILMIHNVAFTRGEDDLYEEMCSKYFSLFDLGSTDFFHVLKFNLERSRYLSCCNQKEDAFDSMENLLIKYKRELESKNSDVCYWKLYYAYFHLGYGDKKKGISMYESVKKDIKSYRLDVAYIRLLNLEIQILYELNEFTAALIIINEFEQISEESNAVEKHYTLGILTCKAHIFCCLRNIDRASSTVVEIETHFKEINMKQSNVLYIHHTLLKARIFWIERNYEEALNVLTESNKIAKRYNLNSVNYVILLCIGRVRIARGEYEIALKELNNAIEFCKDELCVAFLYKGVTLLLLNKFEEAFKELSKDFSQIRLSDCSEKLVDCASKYDILLNFTKERKREYGVDNMEFKTILTACQNEKRKLSKSIEEVNNKIEFPTNFSNAL